MPLHIVLPHCFSRCLRKNSWGGSISRRAHIKFLRSYRAAGNPSLLMHSLPFHVSSVVPSSNIFHDCFCNLLANTFFHLSHVQSIASSASQPRTSGRSVAHYSPHPRLWHLRSPVWVKLDAFAVRSGSRHIDPR